MEEVFVCEEESDFYSEAVSEFFDSIPRDVLVREFGVGDGMAVIAALRGESFSGEVVGYETQATAYEAALRNIQDAGLKSRYVIKLQSFFDEVSPSDNEYLISNPPYVPSSNKEELILPELWGGEDGSDLTKRLLEVGYKECMIMVSSISNPFSVISFARIKGYRVKRFQIREMAYGRYTSQDLVQKTIKKLELKNIAYTKKNAYLLGAVFFSMSDGADISHEFLRCIKEQV